MIVFEAIKKYEGRTQERTLAETPELAKTEARNWVRLHEPPEWQDNSPDWDTIAEPKELGLVNAPKDETVVIKRRGVSEDTNDD